MVKLTLQTPIIIAAVSFLIVWYASVHQCASTRERMTGSPRIKEEDKKNITDFLILSIASPPESKEIKLSPEAQTFINFLNQNPITAIDDKFMQNLTGLIKRMAANDFILKRLMDQPDKIKDGVRMIGSLITAQIIWEYADPYEKLKAAPTQSEFREHITKILLQDPKFQPFITALRENANEEDKIKQRMDASQKELAAAQSADEKKMHEMDIKRQSDALDVISVQTAALGSNTYPLGTSVSPMVNQIFDVVYKYYFGETISTSNLFSGALKAIMGIFGSLGAMAVVAAIVYFVFLR